MKTDCKTERNKQITRFLCCFALGLKNEWVPKSTICAVAMNLILRLGNTSEPKAALVFFKKFRILYRRISNLSTLSRTSLSRHST